MARQYYYLVAGLPDLLFEGAKSPPTVNILAAELEEWVEPPDAALLRTMRLPFDNYNLATLLESQQRPFDTRANYTLEQLTAEIKRPDTLPDYMQAVCIAYREGRYASTLLEDELNAFFHENMSESDNEFVREYFDFEAGVRNVLAATAARGATGHLSGRTPSSVVVGGGDAALRAAKSTAPDFGLGQSAPWVDTLLSFSRDNPVEFEKQIDMLRWNMVSDLVQASHFEIEVLCACVTKCAIVERWARLDAAFGKERLETLVAELQKRSSS